MSRHAFTADAHDDNRLDQAVARAIPSISRRRAKALIGQGSVSINGVRVKVAGRFVPAGARVEVDDVDVADVRVRVIADAAGIVAVDKPAGLASEPTKQASASAKEQLRTQGISVFAIHRLDVDTSGVLLFARDPATCGRFSRAFAETTVDGTDAVERVYLAIVSGVVVDDVIVVDAPLLPPSDGIVRVSPSVGKPARTELRVRARGPAHTLLEVRPFTGRTHQIRVHLAHIGHALAGDRRYGTGRAAHLGLHALRLKVVVDGEAYAYAAGVPAAFVDVARAAGVDAALSADEIA